jgi:hypothetical protein
VFWIRIRIESTFDGHLDKDTGCVKRATSKGEQTRDSPDIGIDFEGYQYPANLKAGYPAGFSTQHSNV